MREKGVRHGDGTRMVFAHGVYVCDSRDALVC